MSQGMALESIQSNNQPWKLANKCQTCQIEETSTNIFQNNLYNDIKILTEFGDVKGFQSNQLVLPCALRILGGFRCFQAKLRWTNRWIFIRPRQLVQNVGAKWYPYNRWTAVLRSWSLQRYLGLTFQRWIDMNWMRNCCHFSLWALYWQVPARFLHLVIIGQYLLDQWLSLFIHSGRNFDVYAVQGR